MAIRLLDPVTIGQIAAGEVIERPASVVKELVENALDAGARRIAVRVAGGGLAEIDVADDGEGIAPEDVARSLLRHATSKLAGPDELHAIRTLGFRGEGLASIVAVARTTIVSRTRDSEIGTAVDAFGEAIGEPYPDAGPVGTRVIVRDLFANVPARRAFLRTPGAEFTRIAQWFGTMSLAYPEVAFVLEHDGRQILAFGAGGDPLPRLRHVFGPGAAALVRVRAGDDALAVDGWISPPGDDRADRRAQILFINGRLLRSTALSGAWSGAYRTFAMTGRYPYGVLFVDIAPDAVDPNVHPTKSDVRLRFSERVNALVRGAMGDALHEAARMRLGRAMSLVPGTALQAAAETSTPAEWSDRFVPVDDVPSATLRVVAQLDRTYVLATDGEAVVLIDQHAAHERVVYEELMSNATHAAPSQPLLVPIAFEVRADQARALEMSREALVASGLAIEPFGERAYRITALPAHTTHAGKTRAFDVAAFLDGLDDEHRPDDERHNVWASLACHSVARAGDALALDEMTVLVERLQRCKNPMHCPHGRPTIVRLEPEAIARYFQAVTDGRDGADGVLILTGPTGSGKTALAIELAQRFGAEIVGADSRQIYRGMPIGTAAPTADDRAQAPHHLVAFLDPWERYSAARYVSDARAAIDAIRARGRRAIVAGGTGFYVRALAGDVTLDAAYDAPLRERLVREARIHPPEVLAGWLRALAPQRAAAVDANDPYRVARALEIALAGRAAAPARGPLPTLRAGGIPSLKLWLELDPAALLGRIERRVDAMLDAGLIAEAERIGLDAVAADAVGYREALAYADGWSTAAELRTQLIRATRRYAKRQATWFRTEPGIVRVAPGDASAIVEQRLGWTKARS